MTDRARLQSAIQAIGRNPVRVDQLTCGVCATPCAPYRLCGTCRSHRSTWGSQLADRVVPLTYAIRGRQSYTDARAYKDKMLPLEQNVSLYRLSIHAYFFNVLHVRCLNKVAAGPATGLVVVPSLSGRAGPHPLDRIAEFLPVEWERIRAAPGSDVPSEVNLRRVVNPEFYSLEKKPAVTGEHIVVFEDTWTSGGHAQGMAVKLKQLGASEVSIVVLNRDISPDFGENGPFLKVHASNPYDTNICPVTGCACP